LSREVWRTSQELSGDAEVHGLSERYGALDPEKLLHAVIETEFSGRIALVSSFGTEAALLLDMVARVDPATPIIFLDTGKLFGETLDYRDRLVAQLGLTDVRTVHPVADVVAADDPDGTLHSTHADLCCHIRKTLPLARALKDFDAWITGRKRHHGGERIALSLFEMQDLRVKVNPLALWDRKRIADEFDRRGLPRRPLDGLGYLSVGCVPCTAPVARGADLRSGRWAGSDKTECGIHLGDDGVPRRPH
jgi:phosphoadenosine phosphosulfate reductase